MDIINEFLGDFTWQGIITTGLRIIMILALAWIGMKILQRFLNRMERDLIRQSAAEGEPPSESQKRVDTLIRLIRQGLLLAIWITASMVILRELGVEIGPIIASAGIAGLAVGFGAQNLVRDIISGFFLILENQVRVGDVAEINGTGGLVEKINFRTTVLRDESGVVHVFPNGTIEKLANMTKEWSAYVFNIRVAYKEDSARVIGIMKDVGRMMFAEEKFSDMMLAEPEIFGVDQLSETAVVIKGRIRTMPIRQWDVGREYLRRIKHAFDEHGIEVPLLYPHMFIGEAGSTLDKQIIQPPQEHNNPDDA